MNKTGYPVTLFIHKPDNLKPIISLAGYFMSREIRIVLAITALLIFCAAGPATAASIGTGWKERYPFEGAPFSGLIFSTDGSTVFAGGNQIYVRSWDGKQHWNGRMGSLATMSTDGNYIAYSLGTGLVMLDKNGTEMWSRSMGGTVRALAISPDGALVVSADDNGNINSWYRNGDFYARNQTALVKQLAISPKGTLVVATTETGLQFLTPALDPVWSDIKNGSVDTDIIFSNDGSTIITAGGSRVSSHTNTGVLNWMNDVTTGAITGIACSYDCSAIVIGSQDSTVQAMDRYGKVHWTYPTGQWPNSVAVSQDANVIAAAGIDQNLYVLDHGGRLLAKKKMDTIIHSRSLAVSPDGRHIVVADEYALNGYTLSPEPDNIELVTLIPTTSPRNTGTPTPLQTSPPATGTTVMPTPVTPLPVTTTPRSPLDPLTALLAAGAGLSLVYRGRKH
jgi:WD40 repeat protein